MVPDNFIQSLFGFACSGLSVLTCLCHPPQAIFIETPGSVLQVTYGGTTLSTPFAFLDCTLPRVEAVNPSRGLSSGGTAISIHVANLRPYQPGVPIRVVFGQEEVDATITAVKGILSASEVTLARINFVTPEVPIAWDTTGSVRQVNGLNIPFAFVFEKECDYELFCFESARLVNSLLLQEDPPTIAACDVKYCLAAEEVPAPFLESVEPSWATSVGGDTVSLRLTGFPAVGTPEQVNVVVGGESDGLRAEVASVQVLDYGGLESTVEVSFVAPPAPAGPGLTDVQVWVNFGARRSEVTFTLVYVRPVSGPLQVRFYAPTSMFSNGDQIATEIKVEMTNVPALSVDAGDPSARNKLLLEIRSAVGAVVIPARAATTIHEWTYEVTKATFPLPSSLSTGTYEVHVRHAASGADRDGLFTFAAVPLGPPVVSSVTPKAVLVERLANLSLSVKYLPVSPSNLMIEYQQSSSTWTSLAVTSTTNTRGCQNKRRSCNTALISVKITPQGSARMSRIRVCARIGGQVVCGEEELELLAADQAQVKVATPNEGLSTGPPAPVTLHVINFPRSLIGGTDVFTSQVRVELDGIRYEVSEWIKHPDPTSDDAKDQIRFILPREGTVLRLNGQKTRQLQGTVYIDGDIRESKRAAFTYTAMRPDGVVSPIDASTAGGSSLTFTVFWGMQLSSTSVQVLFGSDNPATVTSVSNYAGGAVVSGQISFVEYTEIVVTTPGLETTGLIDVSVSAGSASETIALDVYEAPRISMVQPNEASLQGDTGECEKCIVHNKHSVSLWVSGLPTVSKLDELEVKIGSKVCDGLACSILEMQSLADGLYLAVTVPSSDTPGAVPITVTFVGKGEPPLGAAASDDYVRSRRVAASEEGAFAYIEYNPAVVTALYCKVCHDAPSSCVLGTLCGDSTLARTGSSTDAVVPLGGGGVLTLIVINAGTVDPATEPTVTLGSASAPATVRFSTHKMTILEVSVPETTKTGQQPGSIEVSDAVTLTYTLLVYDEKITLTCVAPSSPYTEIPCDTAGGEAMTFQVSGLNIGRVPDIYKSVSVYTGPVAASEVRWVCCAGSTTVILSIDVPSYDSQRLRSKFVNGRAELDFSVVLASDPSIFALSVLTIWAPPKITSALFESSGLAILLQMNQPTNALTLTKGPGSCDSIIEVDRSGNRLGVTQALGDGAVCLWEDSDVLRVNLGAGATVELDDNIAIAAIKNVRSANGISLPMSRTNTLARVGKPQLLLVPGPIKIVAPAAVDPCSAAEIGLIIPSPRDLEYSWSCDNDDALNAYLAGISGAMVSMPKGTPQLEHLDFTYVIHVQATDFLGATTPTETIRVRKTGAPVLGVSVSGQPEYPTTGDVVIKGAATFSECPGLAQGKLLYSWSLSSGVGAIRSDLPFAAADRAKPQLYLPPRDARLTGGMTYRADLTVSNEADSSQASTTSFDLVVVAPTLVAMIAGGADMRVSKHSLLALDASLSHDPAIGSGRADPELKFSWTCVLQVGDLDQPCINLRDDAKEKDDDLAPELVFPNQAKVMISPMSLAATSPGSYYFFTVTVSKGKRITSIGTRVAVINENAPTTMISSSSFSVFDRETGFPKINADSRLNLEQAPGQQQAGFRYAWSVESEQGESYLQSNDAVPMDFDKSIFVLLPPEGTFLPSFKYSIRLTVTNSLGVAGSNVLTVLINQPPTSGVCRVCNQDVEAECSAAGTALTNTFRVSCMQWADDDLPLAYKFGFESSGAVTLSAASDMFFLDMLLPTGVQAAAQVLDVIGAATPLQLLPVNVRQGRRLLSSPGIDNAMAEAEAAGLRGDAAAVNAIAHVVEASIETATTLSDANRRQIHTRLAELINSATSAAAPTVDYAVETMAASAQVAKTHCDLTTGALEALLAIVSFTSGVSTPTAFPVTFGRDFTAAMRCVSPTDTDTLADANCARVHNRCARVHNRCAYSPDLCM